MKRQDNTTRPGRGSFGATSVSVFAVFASAVRMAARVAVIQTETETETVTETVTVMGLPLGAAISAAPSHEQYRRLVETRPSSPTHAVQVVSFCSLLLLSDARCDTNSFSVIGRS